MEAAHGVVASTVYRRSGVRTVVGRVSKPPLGIGGCIYGGREGGLSRWSGFLTKVSGESWVRRGVATPPAFGWFCPLRTTRNYLQGNEP